MMMVVKPKNEAIKQSLLAAALLFTGGLTTQCSPAQIANPHPFFELLTHRMDVDEGIPRRLATQQMKPGADNCSAMSSRTAIGTYMVARTAV
jgi:hypothetical protein